VGSVLTPGTNLVLQASAVAAAPLAYQWERDGADLPGETNSSLSLVNFLFAQAGSYRARISSVDGIVHTRPAVLAALPLVTDQPLSLSVYYGSNAVFNVTALSPTPLRFQWRLNGSTLAGATNTTLIVSNTTYNSGGSYTVIVSNDAGSITSHPAQLTVTGIPTLSIFASAQNGSYGDNVYLEIRPSGGNGDSYQWQFKGQNIPGETGARLYLNNLRPADAGRSAMSSSHRPGRFIAMRWR
jgi:hypothetical protein